MWLKLTKNEKFRFFWKGVIFAWNHFKTVCDVTPPPEKRENSRKMLENRSIVANCCQF
jgi:hypothetical protein